MSDENGSGDWFDTGMEGIDAADKEYEERMGDDLRRFYLKSPTDPKLRGEWESEKEIVFETDEPLCIWEHQLYLDGNWFNWFTCRKAMPDGCEVCNGKDKPYYVGFYLVRDMTGYKNKKGQMAGVGRRVLFPAKRKTLRQIQKFKERRGSLVGKKFFVSRSGDSSPNCGDAFDYVEDVDLNTLPDPGGDKPDLMKVFKPKTNEEIRLQLGRGPAPASGGGGGTAKPPADDDIPY